MPAIRAPKINADYRPILGLPELNRKLRRLPERLQKRALRRSLRQGANVILKEVRARAPTEKLRKKTKVKSARSRRGSVAVRVTVGQRDFGFDDFYGAAKEYGWEGEEPQPFFRTGYDAKKHVALSVFQRDLNTQIIRESLKA